MKQRLINIWNFLFNHKTICGKQWIEDSMTEKYGADWLEQCMEALRNPEVRADLKEILQLKEEDYKDLKQEEQWQS